MKFNLAASLKLSAGVALGLSATGFAFVAAQADTFSDFANKASQAMQSPAGQSALSDGDIAGALKDALAKGTSTAVKQLGTSDGFWGNPRFKIPLPGPVEKIEALLQGSGYGSAVDDLHLQINRAAEQAVPVAADVFGEAVHKLTLQDVRGILNGGQDSATQYFKRTTTDTLTSKFQPIVTTVTSKTGLVQQYNSVMSKAGPLSSMGSSMLGDKGDINAYVTHKALDGLFLRVGDEEKNIRENPAARTTELMQKVFAKQ